MINVRVDYRGRFEIVEEIEMDLFEVLSTRVINDLRDSFGLLDDDMWLSYFI
jgi:hypothetical protein